MNHSALGPHGHQRKAVFTSSVTPRFCKLRRCGKSSFRVVANQQPRDFSAVLLHFLAACALVCCCLGLCFRFESLFPWRSGVTLTFVVHEAAIKRADLPSAFCLTLNPSAAGLIRLYLGCFASLIFATPDFGAFWKFGTLLSSKLGGRRDLWRAGLAKLIRRSEGIHIVASVRLKPRFVPDELKVAPRKLVQQRIEPIDGSALG